MKPSELENLPLENILDIYFELQVWIEAEFRYFQGYRNLNIEDYRGYYWSLNDFSEYTYSDEPSALLEENYEQYGDERYSGEIYHGKVYRTDDFTMIPMDTGCDGNVVLGIFRNDMEVKEVEDE